MPSIIIRVCILLLFLTWQRQVIAATIPIVTAFPEPEEDIHVATTDASTEPEPDGKKIDVNPKQTIASEFKGATLSKESSAFRDMAFSEESFEERLFERLLWWVFNKCDTVHLLQLMASHPTADYIKSDAALNLLTPTVWEDEHDLDHVIRGQISEHSGFPEEVIDALNLPSKDSVHNTIWRGSSEHHDMPEHYEMPEHQSPAQRDSMQRPQDVSDDQWHALAMPVDASIKRNELLLIEDARHGKVETDISKPIFSPSKTYTFLYLFALFGQPEAFEKQLDRIIGGGMDMIEEYTKEIAELFLLVNKSSRVDGFPFVHGKGTAYRNSIREKLQMILIRSIPPFLAAAVKLGDVASVLIFQEFIDKSLRGKVLVNALSILYDSLFYKHTVSPVERTHKLNFMQFLDDSKLTEGKEYTVSENGSTAVNNAFLDQNGFYIPIFDKKRSDTVWVKQNLPTIKSDPSIGTNFVWRWTEKTLDTDVLTYWDMKQKHQENVPIIEVSNHMMMVLILMNRETFDEDLGKDMEELRLMIKAQNEAIPTMDINKLDRFRNHFREYINFEYLDAAIQGIPEIPEYSYLYMIVYQSIILHIKQLSMDEIETLLCENVSPKVPHHPELLTFIFKLLSKEQVVELFRKNQELEKNIMMLALQEDDYFFLEEIIDKHNEGYIDAVGRRLSLSDEEEYSFPIGLHPESIKYMISRRSVFFKNHRGDDFLTVLEYAVANLDMDLVEFLLEEGSNPYKNLNRRKVFEFLLGLGNPFGIDNVRDTLVLEIATLLIKHGAADVFVDITPVELYEKYEGLQRLLNSKDQLVLSFPGSQECSISTYWLKLVVECTKQPSHDIHPSNVDRVEYIRRIGADLKGNEPISILHEAVMGGDFEVIRNLLEHSWQSSIVNEVNEHGKTPLDIATSLYIEHENKYGRFVSFFTKEEKRRRENIEMIRDTIIKYKGISCLKRQNYVTSAKEMFLKMEASQETLKSALMEFQKLEKKEKKSSGGKKKKNKNKKKSKKNEPRDIMLKKIKNLEADGLIFKDKYLKFSSMLEEFGIPKTDIFKENTKLCHTQLEPEPEHEVQLGSPPHTKMYANSGETWQIEPEPEHKVQLKEIWQLGKPGSGSIVEWMQLPVEQIGRFEQWYKHIGSKIDTIDILQKVGSGKGSFGQQVWNMFTKEPKKVKLFLDGIFNSSGLVDAEHHDNLSSPRTLGSISKNGALLETWIASWVKILQSMRSAETNDNVLSYAASHTQRETVRNLLEYPCFQRLIDDVNHNGFTALHIAAGVGDIGMVKLLLSNGADPNIKAKVNFDTRSCALTPLTISAVDGSTEIAQLLISNGADVNIVSENGVSALTCAINFKHYDFVKMLMQSSELNSEIVNKEFLSKKKIKTVPLMRAIAVDHPKDIVELLIRKGANVDYTDDALETPLTYACRKGNNNLSRLLIESGDKVYLKKMKTIDDLTPLMLASQYGMIDVVKLLLLHGVDVNFERKSDKRNALIYAIIGKHTEIAQLLIDKGDKKFVQTEQGFTPLMFAAQRGLLDIVSSLLDNGADINVMITDSSTALSFALKWSGQGGVASVEELSRKRDVVRLLIARGTVIRIKDWFLVVEEWLPRKQDIAELIFAQGTVIGSNELLEVETLQNEIVHMLLEGDADPDWTLANCGSNFTALIVASVVGSAEIVATLLKAGADPNKLDRHRNSALMLAVKNGHVEIVENLIASGAKISHSGGRWGKSKVELTVLALALLARLTDYAIVEILIANGANEDDLVSVEGFDMSDDILFIRMLRMLRIIDNSSPSSPFDWLHLVGDASDDSSYENNVAESSGDDEAINEEELILINLYKGYHGASNVDLFKDKKEAEERIKKEKRRNDTTSVRPTNDTVAGDSDIDVSRALPKTSDIERTLFIYDKVEKWRRNPKNAHLMKSFAKHLQYISNGEIRSGYKPLETVTGVMGNKLWEAPITGKQRILFEFPERLENGTISPGHVWDVTPQHDGHGGIADRAEKLTSTATRANLRKQALIRKDELSKYGSRSLEDAHDIGYDKKLYGKGQSKKYVLKSNHSGSLDWESQLSEKDWKIHQRLSDEERKCVDIAGFCELDGRAGTGKTEITMFRMILNANKAAGEDHFIALNEGRRMPSHVDTFAAVEPEPEIQEPVPEYHQCRQVFIAKSLNLSESAEDQMPDAYLHDPLTSMEFLPVTINPFEQEWLKSRDKKKISFVERIEREANGDMSKALRHAIDFEESAAKHGGHIDYKMFKEQYENFTVGKSKHTSSVLQGTCELSAEVVWTQINTNIKGSFQSFMEGRELTLDEYLAQGTRKGLLQFNPKQKKAIYDVFLRYESLKTSSSFDGVDSGRTKIWYDDMDRILDVVRRLKKFEKHFPFVIEFGKNTMWKSGRHPFDYIFIDEVQDLPPIITALARCVVGGSPDNITVAGDLAQQIIPGVAFTFDNIHNIIARSEDGSRIVGFTASSKEGANRKLQINYRTHAQMIESSSTIMTHADTSAITERSGPTPKIWRTNNKELIDELAPGNVLLFKDEQSIQRFEREFEERLEMIQREKERLQSIKADPKRVGKTVHLDSQLKELQIREEASIRRQEKAKTYTKLTVRESKGLEYGRVVLVNFFSYADEKYCKYFRALFTGTVTDRHKKSFEDDPDLYDGLRNELRLFYVGMTRSITELYIVETSENSCQKSAFDFFLKARNEDDGEVRKLFERYAPTKKGIQGSLFTVSISKSSLIKQGSQLMILSNQSKEHSLKYSTEAKKLFALAGRLDLVDKIDAFASCTSLPEGTNDDVFIEYIDTCMKLGLFGKVIEAIKARKNPKFLYIIQKIQRLSVP